MATPKTLRQKRKRSVILNPRQSLFHSPKTTNWN